jgi:hypothetical protein
MSAYDIAAGRSRNCAESNIVPVLTPALPGACEHNYPAAVSLHKMDIRINDTGGLNLNQLEKEGEIGWPFLQVLITSVLPFLTFSGQESPVNVSAKLREGTPYLSLPYLADFSIFFHHLL